MDQDEKPPKGIPRSLKIVDVGQSVTHEILVGEIAYGGVILRITLKKSFEKPDGEFLPAKVVRKKDNLREIVWKFPSGFEGLGKIRELDDEVIIMLESRERKITEIFPLIDLARSSFILLSADTEKILIGGRSPEKILDLKIALAKDLGSRVVLSEKEQIILRARREAEEKAAKKKMEEAARLRQEKIFEINSRPVIQVYDEAGKVFYGKPVTVDEWMSLAHDTPAVLVDAYDKELKKATKPAMFFFVKKKGTQCWKKGECIISALSPADEKLPRASGTISVDLGYGHIDVCVVSVEALKALREAGVDGDSVVALEEKTTAGETLIISVSSGKVVKVVP